MLRNGLPDTIAEWKALGDGLLTDQSCAFHRNLEISSRDAWLYKFLPAYFKWAGMAAFASHHVRLALFPFRLDTDRTGYVDIPHSMNRQKALLISDVNTIRETNKRHLRRRGTSNSSSTSSGTWCNTTSIASRARSPGSSPSARP